jgi:hypothetical protein
MCFSVGVYEIKNTNQQWLVISKVFFKSVRIEFLDVCAGGVRKFLQKVFAV